MTQYQNSHRPGNNSGGNPNSGSTSYADRYKRTGQNMLNKMYDTGPYVIGIFSFLLAVVCLIALEGIDVVTGKYTAAHMSNPQMGWFFSLGTTGLTLALIGTVFHGWRERWSWKVLVPLAIAAFIPAAIDVLFDGMSVDIIRFGHFINTSVQFANEPVEALMHNLFRIMVGALSAIGEPLAAGSVVIFFIMKDIFKGATT